MLTIAWKSFRTSYTKRAKVSMESLLLSPSMIIHQTCWCRYQPQTMWNPRQTTCFADKDEDERESPRSSVLDELLLPCLLPSWGKVTHHTRFTPFICDLRKSHTHSQRTRIEGLWENFIKILKHHLWIFVSISIWEMGEKILWLISWIHFVVSWDFSYQKSYQQRKGKSPSNALSNVILVCNLPCT